MNASKSILAAVACAAAVGLAGVAAPARASRPVDGQVTGKVTDLRGNDTVYIEGKPFKVQPKSAASKMLSTIHIGTRVDVVLSAPPTDPTARIIGIMPHEKP
jgi:hypothetical protein